MMIIFTQGVMLGLYAAVIPGPLQAFLLSQTLRVGWKRTLPAALSPLLSDGPIILLFLLLLSQAPGWVLKILHGVGGLFLLYLAWGAYRAARQGEEEIAPSPGSGRESFFKAVLMNLLNPNVYVFWGTIGAPIVLEGWAKAPALGLSFLLGMYGTLIPVTAAIVALFGTTGQLNPNARRVLRALSALLLLGLGLYQLWQGIS